MSYNEWRSSSTSSCARRSCLSHCLELPRVALLDLLLARAVALSFAISLREGLYLALALPLVLLRLALAEEAGAHKSSTLTIRHLQVVSPRCSDTLPASSRLNPNMCPDFLRSLHDNRCTSHLVCERLDGRNLVLRHHILPREQVRPGWLLGANIELQRRPKLCQCSRLRQHELLHQPPPCLEISRSRRTLDEP